MDDWVILAATRWKLRRAIRAVNEVMSEVVGGAAPGQNLFLFSLFSCFFSWFFRSLHLFFSSCFFLLFIPFSWSAFCLLSSLARPLFPFFFPLIFYPGALASPLLLLALLAEVPYLAAGRIGPCHTPLDSGMRGSGNSTRLVLLHNCVPPLSL